jgi:hypothetical protein
MPSPSKAILRVILAQGWRFNSFLRTGSLLKARRGTRTVYFFRICRCTGIRQIAGARSNFYLAVRVSGIPRKKSVDSQDRFRARPGG